MHLSLTFFDSTELPQLYFKMGHGGQHINDQIQIRKFGVVVSHRVTLTHRRRRKIRGAQLIDTIRRRIRLEEE